MEVIDVLYVLRLIKNLFTVSAMEDKGYEVYFMDIHVLVRLRILASIQDE